NGIVNFARHHSWMFGAIWNDEKIQTRGRFLAILDPYIAENRRVLDLPPIIEWAQQNEFNQFTWNGNRHRLPPVGGQFFFSPGKPIHETRDLCLRSGLSRCCY